MQKEGLDSTFVDSGDRPKLIRLIGVGQQRRYDPAKQHDRPQRLVLPGGDQFGIKIYPESRIKSNRKYEAVNYSEQHDKGLRIAIAFNYEHGLKKLEGLEYIVFNR